MRGAAVLRRMWTTFCNFYSRASCEARRVQHNPRNNNSFFSTHAPHARRGCGMVTVVEHSVYFYSRASCEARRPGRSRRARICGFLLTRLMRGAASMIIAEAKNTDISTHAPHARRGSEAIFLIAPSENFYSRASCEARHHMSMIY